MTTISASAATVQLGTDATANSTAIADTINHAGKGDVISLPAGSFPIDSPIQLLSGVSIAGVDAAHTTLLAQFSKLHPMIAGDGVSNVEVRGLTLDGNGNQNVTQGINLQKSSHVHINHVTIQNLPGTDNTSAPLGPHGIDCTSNVTDSTFDTITCRQIGINRTWGGGIRLSWKSTGNRVTACTIDGTGRGGIFCNDGAADNVIMNNVVSNSGGVGLGIEVQNSDHALIDGNKIDHWLSVDNSALTAVRRNAISSIDGTYKLCGIEVVDTHDIVVSNNAVNGGAKVGLSISGPKPKTRMIFMGNSFESATTWGAQIQGDAGGASEMLFNANKFLGTTTGPQPLYASQGQGVRLNGGCRSLTFLDNQISQNAGAGVQLTGDNLKNLTFAKNTIVSNAGGNLDGDPKLIADGSNLRSLAVQLAGHPQVHRAVSFSTNGSSKSSYLWDFGDGWPATGPTPTHPFSHTGTFTVLVASWDSDGSLSLGTLAVEVE